MSKPRRGAVTPASIGQDVLATHELITQLSRGLTRDQMQPALVRALRDPSIELVFWHTKGGWFGRLDGRRVERPTNTPTRAVRVIGDPNRPLAAMVYDSLLGHSPHLVDIVASAIHMALVNANLQWKLREQLESAERSRMRQGKLPEGFEALLIRLVQAADVERRKVERNLHDGAQQQLVTVLFSIQLAKAEAIRHSDSTVASLLDESIVALQQSLGELRELARGIHPAILTQAGLLAAVQSRADRCPIPTEVTGDIGPLRLPSAVEATLYFVASEAITNAVKHSRGHRIRISLSRVPGLVSVGITDDGVGGAHPMSGSGLSGLTDRVAALGGRLEVQTTAGSGTSILAEIPCA